ncbi:hypothetical protein BT96DRAFT_1016579 [Gymnopus androsaceus JB14]|uniref:Uncharacterized protein n=1 Tax=Gymnopus androsaceus JB14 TaxID=1447944 RepID=A0A6A4I0E4_9AGAR|nr:hypothetical protein BT96DRAFT_1016579 [Gymnopus androsaceus JB14]
MFEAPNSNCFLFSYYNHLAPILGPSYLAKLVNTSSIVLSNISPSILHPTLLCHLHLSIPMTRPRSYTFDTKLSPDVVVIESYDSPSLLTHDLAASVSAFPNVMAMIRIVREYIISVNPPHFMNAFLFQLSRQVSQAAYALIESHKMRGPEPTTQDVLSFLSDDFPIIHFAELKDAKTSGERGIWSFVDTGLGPSIYLDAGMCRGYEKLCGSSAPKECKLNEHDLFFLLVASLLHEVSHSISWRFLNRLNTPRMDGDSEDPESGQAFEDAIFGGSFAVVWYRHSDKDDILKAAGIELRRNLNKRYYKVKGTISPLISQTKQAETYHIHILDEDLKEFKENLINLNQQHPFRFTGTSSGPGCKIRTKLMHFAEDIDEEVFENQPSAGMGYLPPTPADSDSNSDSDGPFYVTTHCVIAALRNKEKRLSKRGSNASYTQKRQESSCQEEDKVQ